MRLVQSGPHGDTDNATQAWYSAGEGNTGLPDDYSWHARRIGADTDDFRYDVSMRGSAGSVVTATAIDRFWIRFWSWPSTEQGIWHNSSDVHPAVAAGLLTCDPAGVIRFYYKGNAVFPGTIIGVVGQTILAQWHELIVESYFVGPIVGPGKGYVYGDEFIFTGTAHTPTCKAYLDRVLGTVGSVLDSVVVASSSPWHAFRSVIGRDESSGTGLSFDRSNLIVDDAAAPSAASRISAVRVVATGTYQQWANSGLPNYQARNAWPGASTFTANATGIRTVTSGEKQTYRLEDFVSAGITGNIFSAAARIAFPSAPFAALHLIVIRNGVETIYPGWAVANGTYFNYRLDTTGWAITDTIELGIEATGVSRIAGITLTVEHDTPVPPIVVGDIDSTTAVWAGNGTAQSLAAPLADPDFLFYWPRGGLATPGGWWMAGSNSHHTFSVPSALRPNLIVRGGVIDLLYDGADGPNASGVTYDALVIRDPKMRMLGRGAYAATTGVLDDDLPIAMLDPFGGVFAPATLWAGKETTNTNEVARYYGPGMAGDGAVPLSAGAAPAADYIQALTPTGFTAGTLLNNQVQQVAYSGFRKGVFTTSILMDLGSYVGDGVSPRVIPVLIGQVRHAWVWPQNGTDPVYRNDQLASGQSFTAGAGPLANSITALGVGSFTVGSARNSLGVVYSWLVFGYGTDPAPPVPPQPGEGCSDPLPAGTDSGGGLGCKGLLAAGSDSGGGVGCKAGLA